MVDRDEDRFPHHSTPRNRISRSRHTSLNLSSLDSTSNLSSSSSSPGFSALKTIKSSPSIPNPPPEPVAAAVPSTPTLDEEDEDEDEGGGIQFSAGENTSSTKNEEDSPRVNISDVNQREQWTISGPITPETTSNSTVTNDDSP